jgi:hypothetical protein
VLQGSHPRTGHILPEVRATLAHKEAYVLLCLVGVGSVISKKGLGPENQGCRLFL